MMNVRLCPNEPLIAAKIISGEAILINLQTGAYYSLRDTGALVWHALSSHRTRGEILDLLVAHYQPRPAGLEGDLDALLGQLDAEQLVRASERSQPLDETEAPPPASAPYRAPVLEKFTDMEELLALDPPTPGALDNLMRRPIGDHGE